jgi:hypothetical protein
MTAVPTSCSGNGWICNDVVTKGVAFVAQLSHNVVKKFEPPKNR